jgi:hypothetical protein
MKNFFFNDIMRKYEDHPQPCPHPALNRPLGADKSVAVAIANIGSAREALNLAKIILGHTTLTAPYDGVILVRQAELGEVVSPGAAIVTLADITMCGCAPMSTKPTSARSG